MKVVEVFRSIQGEGTQAGRPCVFVRLAGCNLRCAWCDTPYAQDGAGEEVPRADVVARALAAGPGMCCVTGGEPLLQPDAPDLVRALLEAGRDVQVMTNGSLPLHAVPREAVLAVDVKTPWAAHGAVRDFAADSPRIGRGPDEIRSDTPASGAGATGQSAAAPAPADPPPPHFDPSNLSRLSRRDEVKFVVRSRPEFDWACRWAASVALFDRVGTVFAGPAWGAIDAGTVADWILESRLPLRLNVQWHKVLWGADTRR